jgi:hypothetical protein
MRTSQSDRAASANDPTRTYAQSSWQKSHAYVLIAQLQIFGSQRAKVGDYGIIFNLALGHNNRCCREPDFGDHTRRQERRCHPCGRISISTHVWADLLLRSKAAAEMSQVALGKPLGQADVRKTRQTFQRLLQSSRHSKFGRSTFDMGHFLPRRSRFRMSVLTPNAVAEADVQRGS